jgi:hypothetical protein
MRNQDTRECGSLNRRPGNAMSRQPEQPDYGWARASIGPWLLPSQSFLNGIQGDFNREVVTALPVRCRGIGPRAGSLPDCRDGCCWLGPEQVACGPAWRPTSF